jgi:sugar phosphate isomerase/epimerase
VDDEREAVDRAEFLHTEMQTSEVVGGNTFLAQQRDGEQDGSGVRRMPEGISDLAQTAYDHGAVFLLETYVNNVVDSVEETAKMFAQVDHPASAC